MWPENVRGVTKTRDTSFVMSYLPANQCWVTYRQERDGRQALLELHNTHEEASNRLAERAEFHVAKPGMDMSKAGDAYQYSVRNLLTKSIQGKLSLGG